MIFFTNLLIFISLIAILIKLEKLPSFSRNKKILIAIFLGGAIGILMQFFLTGKDLDNAISLYILVGNSYLRFLQMLIFPVVATGILLAFLHIGEKENAIKSVALIVGILLFTTAISVLIGVLSASLFSLDFSMLSGLSPSTEATDKINARASVLVKPLYQIILEFIPTNPFLDLTGARQNSLASIVVFFGFIGFAYVKLKAQNSDYAKSFSVGVETANKLLNILISFALKLTPFGIFGLFAKLTATVSLLEISKLFVFIASSYFAIFVMFIVHGLLLLIFKTNPVSYYKNVFEVLTFAFFSRSSSASIPLNVETQVNKLGLSNTNATISASLGATIGQNGCAGIYPAMLVAMLAPHFDINIFDPSFLLMLTFILAINSFGIAGVGGGAIFAGIAALNAFNMPLAIIAILAGIEPIIDMARTALNVNGSIVSSVITSKIQKQ